MGMVVPSLIAATAIGSEQQESSQLRDLLLGRAIRAECASKAEDEAAELEKILQSQNGGMPMDPEEMQIMLTEARNRGKPKPPSFQQFLMPLKTYTNFRQNNGFHFGFGLPISQRFQV